MSLPSLPCHAVAVYSWSGEQDADLGMIEGDRIEVLDYGDGNWWFGRLQRNKLQGVFPKNYVKVLQIPTSSSTHSLMSQRITKSPSFTPSPKSKVHHSTSHHNLAHSKSNQYLQLKARNELEGFSTTNKFYSTNDLSRLAQMKSSPIRDDVEYESDESGDHEFDTAPPPPPKNKQYSKPRSQISSPSTNGRSSQMLYHQSTSSLETPVPRTPNDSDPDLSMLKNSMHRGNLNISKYSSYEELYDSLMSTDTAKSIPFGHSNFSATSAGSFARHKFKLSINERDLKLKELQNSGLDKAGQMDLMKEMFKNEKQSRHPKLLRSLFGKDLSKVSLDDQIHGLSINEPISSVETSFVEEVEDPRIELLNQVTLTPYQKAKREQRVIEENLYFILKPFDEIDEYLNHNEIVSKSHISIDSIPLYHVDKYIRSMPVDKFDTLESIALNSIAARFSSDLEKMRAIYCFCTERIELIHDQLTGMDSRMSPKMSDIIYNRKATSYQLTWLFKLMAKAVHINTDIILGHFKHPFKDVSEISLNDKLIPNHSWLATLIEGQWRMIDVNLGNLTHEIYDTFNISQSNLEIHKQFYFLTKPMEFIYTHIPTITEQQHIIPPIDTMAALSLPPLYPSYFHYGTRFHRFNNSLAYMKDLEMAEFQIQVPNDVEIIAKVQCDDDEDNEDNEDVHTLVQPLWHKNKKFFVVRSVLPPKKSVGFMKMYVGDKTTHSEEYMMLSSIQLCHQGVYKPLSFVKRYPTIHTLNQDLLIASPQHYQLEQNENYKFIIKQHPSFQVDTYNKEKLRTRLALQSPNGKIIKFDRISENKYYGDWGLQLEINELGLYRGLVLTDDGLRWSVFCEWSCI